MTEELRLEIVRCLAIYEDIIKADASRTRNMFSDYGEIEAISRLMNNGDAQVGFQKLRDSGNLNETFESVVVRFQSEFRPEVVAVARWRLDNANNLPKVERRK